MDEWRAFACNISRLRKERGISKTELARELKICWSSMMKLENGEVPPRMGVEVLFRASRFFNVSVPSLFRNRVRNDVVSD